MLVLLSTAVVVVVVGFVVVLTSVVVVVLFPVGIFRDVPDGDTKFAHDVGMNNAKPNRLNIANFFSLIISPLSAFIFLLHIYNN